MIQIGKGDRLYVFLSEKYLQSPFCMFELFEVWRNSRRDEAEFQRRVRLYLLDDAKIWTLVDRLKYARHWAQEYEKVRSALEGLDLTTLADADFKRFKHVKEFSHHVGDILALFADTVQPKNFDEFLVDGFDD
jgi:internalin A